MGRGCICGSMAPGTRMNGTCKCGRARSLVALLTSLCPLASESLLGAWIFLKIPSSSASRRALRRLRARFASGPSGPSNGTEQPRATRARPKGA